VHTLADKYFISPLRTLAASKFHGRAEDTSGWSSSHFADAIREVYGRASKNDLRLRDSIVTIAAKHGELLFSWESTSTFREVESTVPGFAAELATKLSFALGTERRYTCNKGTCGESFIMARAVPGCTYFCPVCGEKNDGKILVEWCEKGPV